MVVESFTDFYHTSTTEAKPSGDPIEVDTPEKVMLFNDKDIRSVCNSERSFEYEKTIRKVSSTYANNWTQTQSCDMFEGVFYFVQLQS